jgi:hypothetical protein
MIKVNYYFNSQILFSEYIISFDSIHINKNHKLYHDNRLYIVTNCYYDLFEKTVDAILMFAPNFQYEAYIKMKSDNIIQELEMLGYTKSDVAGEGKYMFISNGCYYFTDNDYSKGGLGYVCETAKQFIAIAAIREDSDIYQWFKFPNNEIEKCECISYIDEFGDFEDSPYPTKLTPEEILKYIK